MMFRIGAFFGLLLAVGSGCALSPRAALAPTPPISNPLFVPAHAPEFLWSQIVDSVDDHFRIRTEERIRVSDGVITEGRIDTYPTIGSTFLEPWRNDSVGRDEKTLATLQSIRRFAEIRVVPTQGGFLVHVQVAKELEDLLQPDQSTVSQGIVRHDQSFVRNSRGELENLGNATLGWLPRGRDTALEQRILADLQARLSTAEVIAPSN